MLNFNTIDTNPNTSFSHPIPLHGGNFNEASTMITSSPSNHHHNQTQAQQINLNFLGTNTSGDQTNWTHSDSVTNSTIDDNCNRNNNNNNLSNPSETGRAAQHQKDYLQTVIGADESDGRSTLNMGNFLQQKGSENVKRFSVNNLLQLANNCRALVDEHRLSTGKKPFKRMIFFL